MAFAAADFSFDPTLAAGETHHALRSILQDTNAMEPVFSDTELTALIAQFGGVREAVIPAARRMKAKVGLQASDVQGAVKITRSNLVPVVAQLLQDLLNMGYPDSEAVNPNLRVSRAITFSRGRGGRPQGWRPREYGV